MGNKAADAYPSPFGWERAELIVVCSIPMSTQEQAREMLLAPDHAAQLTLPKPDRQHLELRRIGPISGLTGDTGEATVCFNVAD